MILKLQDISKTYGRGRGCRVALDGVSLELERGRITGIFGPSGAGKTTLLRIAAGLETPDSGGVLYKGERMDKMPASELRRYRRREVGCIWAGEAWPSGMSIREQVELPLLIDQYEPQVAKRIASELLLACEAEHCIDLMPDELSDGELLRVAVARALVVQPRLVIVDGVIAGLSIIEQHSFMELLASLAHDAKVAVLVADTGASQIIRADPILYLRDGKLIAPTPEDEPGRLYKLPTATSRRSAADA